jgi:hypothetical protein
MRNDRRQKELRAIGRPRKDEDLDDVSEAPSFEGRGTGHARFKDPLRFRFHAPKKLLFGFSSLSC